MPRRRAAAASRGSLGRPVPSPSRGVIWKAIIVVVVAVQAVFVFVSTRSSSRRVAVATRRLFPEPEAVAKTAFSLRRVATPAGDVGDDDKGVVPKATTLKEEEEEEDARAAATAAPRAPRESVFLGDAAYDDTDDDGAAKRPGAPPSKAKKAEETAASPGFVTKEAVFVAGEEGEEARDANDDATRESKERVRAVAFSSKTVRCAFVTLLIERRDVYGYASFLESTHRARAAFALEAEYPHVIFHEAGFPETHKVALHKRAPWVRFVDLEGVWGEPASAFMFLREATDRSLGYNHMCRFYAAQIFDVAGKSVKQGGLGLDLIFRFDDDIFFLKTVPYDPFRVMWETSASYAYGVLNTEDHDVTHVTLPLWLEAEFGDASLANGVVNHMYFNNVFAANPKFFLRPEVKDFSRRVDESGGIFKYRWGDAPLQTAAVRLFGAKVVRFPDVAYVHFSTDNLISDGDLQCLKCDHGQAYLRRAKVLEIERSDARARPGRRRLHDDSDDDAKKRFRFFPDLDAVAEVHRAAFVADLRRVDNDTKLWRDFRDGRTLPVAALLRAALDLSIWCDGAGRVHHLDLLPRFCCCKLAPFHDDLSLVRLRPRLRAVLDAYRPYAAEFAENRAAREQLTTAKTTSSPFGVPVGDDDASSSGTTTTTPDRRICPLVNQTCHNLDDKCVDDAIQSMLTADCLFRATRKHGAATLAAHGITSRSWNAAAAAAQTAEVAAAISRSRSDGSAPPRPS